MALAEPFRTSNGEPAALQLVLWGKTFVEKEKAARDQSQSGFPVDWRGRPRLIEQHA
jgi:hypothetical protein